MISLSQSFNVFGSQLPLFLDIHLRLLFLSASFIPASARGARGVLLAQVPDCQSARVPYLHTQVGRATATTHVHSDTRAEELR